MRVALLLMLVLFSTPPPSGGAPAASSTPGGGTPVLLELFTSEGCSSCPPADRLLATLDQSQPVPGTTLIVLSEHVDYWNQLGWADPFSAAAYSQRQHEYATRLHLDSVYTPQIVVDGRYQAVGNDPQEVRAAVDKAAKTPKTPLTVAISRRGEPSSSVTVVVDMAASPTAGTVFVALASDQEQSQVKRGENSGKSLGHVAVVYKLAAIGHAGKKSPFHQEYTLEVPASGDPHRWRVVTFVQNERTGEILGVQQEHL